MRIAIINGTIINEGARKQGILIINNNIIEYIGSDSNEIQRRNPDRIVDAEGLWILPGIIDDQVHFREPGLTRKGDIYTESRAAVAGGVTSYMEMPNTIPQTTTVEELEKKNALAAEKSLANYSFYFGATNNNFDELVKVNPNKTCGIKVFMGSSTGNMLVDDEETLVRIFKHSPKLIATHCEDEQTIRRNTELIKQKYGENPPFSCHAEIRNEEACYISSRKAVDLAKKNGARLHLLHLSTAKELTLLDNSVSLKDKKITGEVCAHHLWFNNSQYDKLGWRIKWNPSVKTEQDRISLISGLNSNLLDVVATDHAPHLIEEKDRTLFNSASGGPMVQHSLVLMLELHKRGYFPLETVVEKMCHAPAVLFKINKRGFIREGYFADIILVNPNKKQQICKESLLYKCNWSPLEGETLNSEVVMTIINGRIVYDNGHIDESVKGNILEFGI